MPTFQPLLVLGLLYLPDPPPFLLPIFAHVYYTCAVMHEKNIILIEPKPDVYGVLLSKAHHCKNKRSFQPSLGYISCFCSYMYVSIMAHIQSMILHSL